MSLKSASPRSPPGTQGMTPEDLKVARESCSQIANYLQAYEKKRMAARSRLTNMKDREVSPVEKNDLDIQVAELKDLENRTKELIIITTQKLNSYPVATPTNPTVPADIVQFRTVLSKLNKDYEKIKVTSMEISTDLRFVRINPRDTDEYNQLRRDYLLSVSPGSINNAGNSGGNSGGSSSNSNSFKDNMSVGGSGINSFQGSSIMGGSSKSNKAADLHALQKLQEKEFVITACDDVDITIINERSEDITKIHQGTIMLNEMFTDLAVLVDAQGSGIAEVAHNVNVTHEKTETGLKQVIEAEKLQAQGNRMCVIS